jgi:stearoyl-CoA desaturase (delta-9 desaturase)
MATSTFTFGRQYQKGVNWLTTIVFGLYHAVAVTALFYIDVGAIIAAAVLWGMAGMLGIGMGYHRLLTHRGYKTYRWVEYFLAICGTLALEGGPIFWVATHRVHHQRSDQKGDPHTPREGGWWAHMGWILTGAGLHHDAAVLSKYAPDLCRDSFYRWLSNWHWLPNVVIGIGLLVFGGLQYVLWGVAFRTVWGLHSTWLVNSATHMWGSRRFKTRDDSTNNWWVALLTFGEGWHNNHHAHPVSARHGLRWYELDLNWIGISLLRKCKLAWDVNVAEVAAPVSEDVVVPDEAIA